MKWKSKYKLMSALFLVSLAIVVSFFYFKNSAAHYAIDQYARSKGINLSFEVEHFSPSDIRLKNIVLESDTHISQLHLSFGKSLIFPSKIEIGVESLNPLSFQQALKKITGSTKNEKMSFQSLQKTCQTLLPVEIEAHIQNVIWENDLIPIQFKFSHQNGEDEFVTSFEGISKKPALEHNGKINLKCGASSLDISIDKLDFLAKNYLKQKHIQLSVLPSHISILQNDQIEWDVTTQGQFDGSIGEKPLHFDLKRGHLSQTAPMDDLWAGNIKLNLDDLVFLAPKFISMNNLILYFKKSNSTPTLNYTFLGLDFKNDEKKEVVHNLSSQGTCLMESTAYKCRLSVDDPTHTFAFKELPINYNTATSEIELQFLKKKNSLIINQKMSVAIPLLEKLIQDGKGNLNLVGPLNSTPIGWSGSLKISGENTQLTTEFGTFNHVSLDHDLLSYPTFESSGHRHLVIGEYQAGFTLQNIDVFYKVLSAKQIAIETLSFNYDGAEVRAQNFSIFPEEKHIQNFHATVKKYPLKKLLALALKIKSRQREHSLVKSISAGLIKYPS